MGGFFRLKTWQALVVLVVLETLCVGMGMGVPAFAILLGFPIGWWLARRARTFSQAGTTTAPESMRKILLSALVPSLMTLAFMAAIWLPQLALLSKPGFDVAQWGIPLWLYTPMASFVGWMVLMVVISPMLQLLAVIFGAYLTLMSRGNRGDATQHDAEAAPGA